MSLVSPAVVNCTGFQGFCRRPWTKKSKAETIYVHKPECRQNPISDIPNGNPKSTHSAPNFNLGKKRKENRKSQLSSHSQRSASISLATGLSFAALFDPITFAFLLKLGSQSVRCPVDQAPYPLPSLNVGKEKKKKENYGGSDSYYLYVKISKDHRFRWDLNYLI